MLENVSKILFQKHNLYTHFQIEIGDTPAHAKRGCDHRQLDLHVLQVWWSRGGGGGVTGAGA